MCHSVPFLLFTVFLFIFKCGPSFAFQVLLLLFFSPAEEKTFMFSLKDQQQCFYYLLLFLFLFTFHALTNKLGPTSHLIEAKIPKALVGCTVLKPVFFRSSICAYFFFVSCSSHRNVYIVCSH